MYLGQSFQRSIYFPTKALQTILSGNPYTFHFQDSSKYNKLFLPYVKKWNNKRSWAAIIIEPCLKYAYYIDPKFGSNSDSKEEDESVNFQTLQTRLNNWLTTNGMLRNENEKISLKPYRITGLRCYDSILEDFDSGIFIQSAFLFIYKHCPLMFLPGDMEHFRLKIAHSIMRYRIKANSSSES